MWRAGLRLQKALSISSQASLLSVEDQDASSLLLFQHHAYLPAAMLLPMMVMALVPIEQNALNKPFFYKFSLPWCFITVIEK